MQLSLPDDLERHTFIAALHVMAEWPLAELFEFLDGDSERASKLGRVTVAELLRSSSPACLLRAKLVLELAPQLSGDKFDQLALSVLNEVYPKSVKASFLRHRLGVPRWRVQSSMLRLVAGEKWP